MKYVLYKNTVYEINKPFCYIDQNGFLVLSENGIINDAVIAKSEYAKIKEAEYHARKLLEIQQSGDVERVGWAYDGVYLKKIIKQCEAERTPKPEVTEAHIGCLVERASIGEPFCMRKGDTRICNDLRLPRQPVPLAFHKCDGKRPEWVKDDWLIICCLDSKDGELRSSSIKEARVADWQGATGFAVIKPILGE